MADAVCGMSAPLVSIVVRSMGRPELHAALGSLARQDHPHLEVIVVDATGGRHPALPILDWQPGHSVRLVGGDRPLKRPDAANVGLEHVRGHWFSFLDDDDTCEPAHVSTLVSAAQTHSHALVVYGRGRLLDPQGRLQALFGQPFNRALMHYGPLCYWQASLIRTRVRDLGCRFDPVFDICEDRDFLAQIAQHGDFAFVPVATLNYRPDLGTSGTGRGGNCDDARRILFDTRLRAKWSGPGEYHSARAAYRCRRGVRAFLAGGTDDAQRWFGHALRDYPGDPNAMNGLARIALARGQVEAARRYTRAAVEVNPSATEYAATLALVQRAAGETTTTPRRNEPCRCASGRRYKDCCGQVRPSGRVDERVAETTLESARRALARGDAAGVSAILAPVLARGPDDRDASCLAAQAALMRDDVEAAYRTLAAVTSAAPNAVYGRLVQECCDRMYARERRQALWAMAHRIHARLGERAAPTTFSDAGPMLVCLVGHAPDRTSFVRHAAALGVDVREASLEQWRHGAFLPPATLVLQDECCELAEWLDAPVQAARIVLRVAGDDPQALIERLVEIEESNARMPVDIAVASRQSVERLAGAALLEYPWIDPALFALSVAAGARAATVGVHRTDLPGTPHPHDAALYRSLRNAGLDVKVPPHPALQRALADDGPDAVAWLPDSTSAAERLAQIDIVVYRHDAASARASDLALLEAMAAACALVVFDGSASAPELIEDGRNALVVRSQDDALAAITDLARDAAARRALGAQARMFARRLLEEQRRRAAAFYRGVRR